MKSFSDMTELDVTAAEAVANDDLVSDAAHNLQQIFKDVAGSEALTRALVAERSENPEGALLWVKVYLRLQSP